MVQGAFPYFIFGKVFFWYPLMSILMSMTTHMMYYWKRERCLLSYRDDKTMAKAKGLKDSTYAMFLKNRGFKDIKYDVQTRLQSRRPNSRTCVLVDSKTEFLAPKGIHLSPLTINNMIHGCVRTFISQTGGQILKLWAICYISWYMVLLEMGQLTKLWEMVLKCLLLHL